MSLLKLVLAHDGSQAAGDTLPDLARAGLGDAVHCDVLSVVDYMPGGLLKVPGTWLPSVADLIALKPPALETAGRTAEAVTLQVRKAFPRWEVTARAATGSPSWEIVRYAELAHANLVVVGARGQSLVAGLMFGSVSLGVALHAPCSVRVARLPMGRLPAPSIVLGVDGSAGSRAMVAAVASRAWPEGTTPHLVLVVDHAFEVHLGGRKGEAAATLAAAAIVDMVAKELSDRGFVASTEVRRGDPKAELVKVASERRAESLFVGARGLAGQDRLALGSVATAVMARAACSVEIVRT